MTPGRISFAATIAFAFLSVPARAETIQVTIDKLVFAPAEVSAKVGDTIEWINKDALVHTATARNGDWDVNIPASQRGQIELKKAGTVDYYCKLHPNMTGRVVVASD
ncbi:MAG TPA: cupredoxin family copper-binding protein [Pseudolabrys sp.]|nr:cupredoxin family copper-binding protein [Pseudolabrys sp.]